MLNAEGTVEKCLLTAEDKVEEETELPSVLSKDSFLLIRIKL